MESSYPTLLSLLFGGAFMLTPLFTPVVSVLYFRASPRSQRLPLRLAASAHGIAITLTFVFGIAFPYFGSPDAAFGQPFQIACLLCVSIMLSSFFLFQGKKVFHFLQLINLLGVASTLFLGGMAITGVWL
jgi:hypothetical protein